MGGARVGGEDDDEVAGAGGRLEEGGKAGDMVAPPDRDDCDRIEAGGPPRTSRPARPSRCRAGGIMTVVVLVSPAKINPRADTVLRIS